MMDDVRWRQGSRETGKGEKTGYIQVSLGTLFVKIKQNGLLVTLS
jgi:hypothetical protein